VDEDEGQKHAATPKDGADEAECLDRLPSLARVIVVAVWVTKPVHEQAEGHEPEDHHDEVPEIVDDRDSEWDKEDEGGNERDTGDYQSINNPPVRVDIAIGVAELVPLYPCRESDDDSCAEALAGSQEHVEEARAEHVDGVLLLVFDRELNVMAT